MSGRAGRERVSGLRSGNQPLTVQPPSALRPVREMPGVGPAPHSVPPALLWSLTMQVGQEEGGGWENPEEAPEAGPWKPRAPFRGQ